MSKVAKVTIVTNDGKNTQVDVDVAKDCKVIGDKIKEASGNATKEKFNVDIKKTQLRMITDYLKRAKKSKQSKQQPGITAWERRYFGGMDRNDLFGKILRTTFEKLFHYCNYFALECMNAAVAVGVPALVDHSTTYIAERIRGKCPKEVAEFFNATKEFPDELITELTQYYEKIEIDEQMNE